MTNGPLGSLPALETEETLKASCQQLSGAGANNNKRGTRGATEEQAGTKHFSFSGRGPAGLMARSAFQHFDIFHLLHRTKQPTIFTNLYHSFRRSTAWHQMEKVEALQTVFCFRTQQTVIIDKFFKAWICLWHPFICSFPAEAQWPLCLLIAELRSGHYQLLPITLNQAAGPAWQSRADTPTTTLTK